jgi:hypothetical protein
MSERLMLDPSFLFSEDGLDWLESEPLARSVVIPATLVVWLRQGTYPDPSFFISPDDFDGFVERRDRLLVQLPALQTFSRVGVDLQGSANEVLEELVARDDPVAGLRGDEWAFVQSQSWLVSKLGDAKDAFRDAGTAIVEFGGRFRHQLIRQVIPSEHIPDALTPSLLARASAKWLIAGGIAAGGGTLGGVVGTVAGGPVGALLGAHAGGVAFGGLSKAAVLAIDP